MILAERAIGVAIGIGFAVLAWQATDRAYPSTMIKREVVTPVVQPGGKITVRVVAQRHFPAEVTFYRTLFDGINLRYEYGIEHWPARSLNTFPDDTLTEFSVPPGAAPGSGRLITTVCWERPYNLVHKMWPVCATMKPLTFTIAAVK